jgi:hypothetical protein
MERDRRLNAAPTTTALNVLAVALATAASGVLASLQTLAAAESSAKVDYTREVRPIFAARCAKCHSAAFEAQANLRLDSPDALRKGGDSGPLWQTGKSADSLLIQRVTATDDSRMPPTGDPLTPEQTATLRRWIDQGAPLPSGGEPLRHWSIEPLANAPLPAPRLSSRLRGPVDAWLQAERERAGVAVAETASRGLLARRLAFDLVGLPPEEDQLAELLADDSPDAIERYVDRLLASPAYGERWGRHWMDVWRYSDWDGYGAEVRESQPHIWRWRDWIVESLNRDTGYNRMVLEMLAGDELAPDDPETLRATGFLVRNWFKFNRNVWLDNTVEHTGKAFLGLTFNCARCHDHMYDAIRQSEYYGLRAIFEPYDVRTDRQPGQADSSKDGLARSYDARLETPTFFFVRGDEKQPLKDKPVAPSLPAWLTSGKPFAIEPVNLPPAGYYPNSRSFVHEESLATANAAVAAAELAERSAREQLAAAQSLKPDPVPAEPTAAPMTAPMTAPGAASNAGVKNADVKNDAGTSDVAKNDAASRKANAGEPLWRDDFKTSQPDVWRTGAGRFEYANGRLRQLESKMSQCALTTVAPHPRDFRATLRFKITGGTTYKSMGLSFDVAGEDANYVYLSAYGGGSKVQAALRRGGADSYPTDAAKSLPITVDREYELAVLVVANRLNVYIDGEFALAWNLPSRPADGRLAIWCFDATGEFLRLETAKLAATTPLVEPSAAAPAAIAASAGNAPAATGLPPIPPGPLTAATIATRVTAAEAAVELAAAQTGAARAAMAAVSARILADQAFYATPSATDAKTRALAASTAERLAAVAAAEAKAIDTRIKAATAKAAVRDGDEKSRKASADADKAAADAVKALETARAQSVQPNEQYTRFGTLYPTTSSGRRLALARWIADDANPLAPRVAVNHMWLRHFGTALVPTVFEFGMNGQPPTHPELLDSLARTFVSSGWSMKTLHRQLVTSDAFRLSSTPAGDAHRIDPDNKTYWRMNSRRMEAELVRDSTLAVAGNLDRRFSGPDLDPGLGLSLGRRSLYFRTSKEKKMTFLALFDSANVSECYRRTESVAPQQALALVNSGLTLAQSRSLAAQLSHTAAQSAASAASSASVVADAGKNAAEAATDRRFIELGFSRILGRSPTPAELDECLRFVEAQTRRLADTKTLTSFTGAADAGLKPATEPRQRARENLVLALFNHNDFLTIR